MLTSPCVSKKMYKLHDFTDMLELFVHQAPTFKHRFKLTFLDEAQDLSPLQWDIAHILDGMSDKMYCAGDDDQAIYCWAGADVDHFINLDGGSEILETSFRIPQEIHNVAENISKRISRRFPSDITLKQIGQGASCIDYRRRRHGGGLMAHIVAGRLSIDARSQRPQVKRLSVQLSRTPFYF